MRPSNTERTSRSTRITTPHPHPLQLDRPPDHVITLVSDHLTDIHSTTDRSITAVFPIGAGELHCALKTELQDIVAVRILHNSLPPAGARLSLSIGGSVLSGTAGGGVDYSTVERMTAPPGADPNTSEVVHRQSGYSPLSYEFPLVRTSHVSHEADPVTGKMNDIHETPGNHGLLHRTLNASDITPMYLAPSGLNGDHGSVVSNIITRWLDPHGMVISRVRNVEDFRTIRICMTPKVILAHTAGGSQLPAGLTGMLMTPHTGGSVLRLSIMEGEYDASRISTNPHPLISTSGDITRNGTLHGHSLMIDMLIDPITGTAEVSSITSPGLGYVVGDTITIRSNATFRHSGNIPGLVDVVLRVESVSDAHPYARASIVARVLVSSRPSPDIFGHGITTLESPFIPTTTTTNGTYLGGHDVNRRQRIYRNVIVGQTPYVRFATVHNLSIPDNPHRNPDFPLIFDLSVDATGNAEVAVTSMGGGYFEGGGVDADGNTIPKNYIYVDPEFFMANDASEPPNVAFRWRPKTYGKGAHDVPDVKPNVDLATTPAFVHDYKWKIVSSGELICATPGVVNIDGVPLREPGTRVLVQSLSDPCTTECIVTEAGHAVGVSSQYNGIYILVKAGTSTDSAVLTPSTRGDDAFRDYHFANRINVLHGALHGNTSRVPLLTSFHALGQPLHFRQWTGTNDMEKATSVAELEYLRMVGSTWKVLAQPPFTFGSGDLVDVYSSLQDAQNGASLVGVVRPHAVMLQLGGIVRDTLELASSPYTHLSRPFMHLARIAKASTSDPHSRTFSHMSRTAVEELYTEESPPVKQIDGNGPAPPRHVRISGGLLMVDVDIPNKGHLRPTADRIDVGDTIAITSDSSHNATLRLSRSAAVDWVAVGGITNISPRIHSRGVGHVIQITPCFREEVGIMPWSLTLGLYSM